MRVADKMAIDQVNQSLQKNRQELSELQNQAAMQKRITKPSDDPLAATRVLAARTNIANSQQFLKNIGQAKAFLEYSEQSLAELSEVLSRAKELAISQSNDASGSRESRELVATEVEGLYGQAVQVGNRKFGDRFLFGGFRTQRAPFDGNGNYRGDDGEMKISINKEAAVSMNMPGSRIFLGRAAKASASTDPSKVDPKFEQLDSKANSREESDQKVSLRGPASDSQRNRELADGAVGVQAKGVNVFSILGDLEVGLRANDKETIQESLDRLDLAIEQVIMSRAQLGSRMTVLNSTMEALQKGTVESKMMASSLEDSDTFELVSDINKTESTLKAALSTSGKLIQPSLLDFLR